jgi:tetratricopeptide (TPR) repeat protein
MTLGIVVWPGPAALAGEKRPPEQNPAAQQTANETRQFSEEAGKLVNAAVNYTNAEQYQKAIATLKNTLNLSKLSPYEAAVIYQMLGAALYEIDDYDGAIRAFESAMSSGGLLPKEASNLRINIAQLLIASGKPERGAQMFEDWMAGGGKLKPKYIAILWQAWSQAEQYDRALPWAEKWFENANPKQRKHYDLLYFIYDQLNMQDEGALIVEQINARWPDNRKLK